MSTLQDMLTGYAIESGVIENHAEITINTMDTMTDLEVEIEDLAKKSKDATDEIDHLVKSSDAIVSAEAFVISHINQINRLGQDDTYSRTTQRLAWSGLEESLESLGFDPRLFSDLTTDYSFEADEPKEQATKDVEKSKSFLKRFWELLVAVGKRLKAVFVRLIDVFRSSSEKNKRSIDILGEELKKRSGGTAKEGEMKTSAFSTLMMDGKLDPTKAVANAVLNYKSNVLGAQEAIHGEVAKLHGILNAISANKSGLQKLGEKLKSIFTLGMAGDKMKVRDVLTGIYKGFPKNFNFTLGGGINAVYTVNTSTDGQLGIKFGLTKPTVKAPDSAPVPSMEYLTAIHKVMTEGQKVLDSIVQKMQEETKVTDALIKQVDDLSKISFESKADNELAHTIGSAVQALAGVGNTFLPTYNKYVVKLQHSSYKYAMSALSRYSKAGKSDDAKGDKK